jgi:PAS domain-containing protein
LRSRRHHFRFGDEEAILSTNMPCSIEAFSSTVEVIYDCALEPERWRDAVRMIAEISKSPLSSIGVFDTKTGENLCLYDYGYTPEFWLNYQPYANEHPIMPVVQLMPVGSVTTIATGCGDEEFFGSRVYREVLQPMGYCDFIGLLALRTGGRIGYLHACRREAQPRFSDQQVKIFGLLSKHVCRAMKISDLFDLRTLQSEMLEATLDRLTAGVFLLARDGRVVHMNAAAERQIKIGNALRIVNHRLSPTDSAAVSALTASLSCAVDNEADTEQSGHTLALPDRSGSGLAATILPLAREAGRVFRSHLRPSPPSLCWIQRYCLYFRGKLSPSFTGLPVASCASLSRWRPDSRPKRSRTCWELACRQ